MAELWKGAPVAAALTERLCGQAERLRARGISPTLAIVRVGERAEDLSYERGACKRCEMIGISVKHFILPVNCTQEELLTVIRRINEDGAIHGCLLSVLCPDTWTRRRCVPPSPPSRMWMASPAVPWPVYSPVTGRVIPLHRSGLPGTARLLWF